MVNLKPFDILMWTVRRNEHDIVNMYDSLSPMMQITTNGDMLNFGYWDKHSSTPLSAQTRLCDICLLYTSPSPRDRQKSRMPSSA